MVGVGVILTGKLGPHESILLRRYEANMDLGSRLLRKQGLRSLIS